MIRPIIPFLPALRGSAALSVKASPEKNGGTPGSIDIRLGI
jgi:hypothetical protein